MKNDYLYDIDDRLPLQYAVIYGLQWASIMFPVIIITANLGVGAFSPGLVDGIRFLQLSLLTSGVFTVIQTLWGHRYPLLEGPSTALILSFMLLAPSGLREIQGGMIIGAVFLVLTVLSGQLQRLIRLFSPNVVGVILILIALGLLRALLRFMTGVDTGHPQGEGIVFIVSILLTLFIAGLSYRLPGFSKTISILIGMFVGSLIFLLMGRLDARSLASAPWVSVSNQWISTLPGFSWAALASFVCAYLAVMVNSLGSLQGIAVITDQERLAKSTPRGIVVNGVAGIVCGFLGIVGTVSFSMSPGVILVNRVASRFAITYCGVILVIAAFIPKLAALLALVPSPVVGAALCVAMGGQVGVGIAMVASKRMTSRDYFVVGIPLLLGSLAAFLPRNLFDGLPGSFQVFVGNSLIIGIGLVLLLEHLILREAPPKK